MEISFIILQILKNWWWIILPIILLFPFKFFYFWWINWDVWYKKNKWILLEIKPPEEILKPFKAMEDVIHALWGVYDSPNWRERWCEGELPNAPYWFSIEIASFGGTVHFFLRILKDWQDTFEAAFYSYYPEAEITVVEDYTEKVPQNIPNKEWDLYGEEYTFMRDDIYPIRTYPVFFEERPEISIEEKRVDPMYGFLEALSKLQPAEQFWLQIVAAPITNRDIPWISRGREIADKIAKRPESKKPKPMLQEALETLISGPPAEEKKEVRLAIPELVLTPGEREILHGVENKISKQGFKTCIRILYLYKVEEPHLFGNYKMGRSYFNHFATENLNTIVYLGPTRSRIHYWLRGRRLYLRKRKQFKYFVDRLPPHFPWNLDGEFPFIIDLLTLGRYPKGPGLGRGTIILNAEELATLFHFPPKIIVPTVPRVEAKKGGPPPELPIE